MSTPFFPYHTDKVLAKLTWPEWLAMREAQGMLGRLPRMCVTKEYQPKKLVPLPYELDDGTVRLAPDGRILVG